jgi:hypothetical protein
VTKHIEVIYTPLTYDDIRQTGNPQTQPVNGAQTEDELGVVWEDYDGKKYIFVKFDSGATVTGSVVPYGDALSFVGSKANFTVTNDISDGNRNNPAGVIQNADGNTPGNKGWIQFGGNHPAVKAKSGDTFAAGTDVILYSNDGEVAVVSAGSAPTYESLGKATADQSTGAVSVDLSIVI